MPSTHLGTRGLSILATGCLVLLPAVARVLPAGAVAQAGALAEVVAATSPLGDAAHGYPFNATPMDLARQGYVEEEFFISGAANRYNTPQMATGTATDGGHPYKTRIVVRRPKSQSRFNGTAIVEWINVSQGHDNEVDWFQSGAHLVRSGFAWIGVSAQRVGVDALKQWSPVRYGALDVSDGGAIANDALSYDIFTAAARAVRGRDGANVMGGLKVERMIATGHSQSAGRLYTYFTSVHPLAPVFDGVVLHGGGGQVRADLDIKVWKFLSETDVPGQASASRQPDTDRFRWWEVAGTSHLDAQLSRGLGQLGLRAAGGTPVDGPPAGPAISGGGAGIGSFQVSTGAPNDGCEKPIFSRVPSYHAQNALYDYFARWLKDGTPPPTAPHIELKQLPANPPAGAAGPGGAGARAGGPRGAPAPEGAAPAARGGQGGPPPPPRYEVIRDELGNALGGIRLSQHAVPTATNTGQNAGGMFCGLLGSYEPFDSARLASLYPTHDAYVAKVKDVTEKNLKAGFIVKEDADQTIADARSSKIGRR
jgi:Alpha/beta hydrolase domain